MTSRAGSSRFDDRDYYGGGAPTRRREDVEYYERERRESAPARREFDETQVRVRERERETESRVPAFMRDDGVRRVEAAGPLVLRSREVETVERPRARPRSPSPAVRVREERIVHRARSLTPVRPPVDRERVEIRDRVIERERIRSPSRGPRYIERSPSPPPMVRTRVVERGRQRSYSPERNIERERIIIERERERERIPSPSPSPPPPPEPTFIRGPTIEREVITHYRDIDHGIVMARPPSPPPQPKVRARERETEIDIVTSRHRTEVDIRDTSRERVRRGRSVSRVRPSPARLPSQHRHDHVQSNELVVHAERNRLEVEIDRKVSTRRAQSAAPPAHRHDYDDDEGEYITSRINERGRMGEAWHGHTKDWTIVDVPPGTERVRMDGVGGGGAEVTWQRYNGVRRAKFIPEREQSRGPRDSGTTVTSTSTSISADRDIQIRDRDRERDRLSVAIYDKDRDRDREIEIEKVSDRRISIRNPQPSSKRSDMWTEITKDLVTREAIEEMGYEYEETEWFYYVMQYLRYEDVLELVKVSDEIRRHRKDRLREIQWEREYRDDWERRQRHHHHYHDDHHHHRRRGSFDNEVTIERERIVDRGPAMRSHFR